MEDYEKLVEQLRNFYGFITPEGEFKQVEKDQTHYDLAFKLMEERYANEINNININYTKDFLVYNKFIAICNEKRTITCTRSAIEQLTDSNLKAAIDELKSRHWRIDILEDPSLDMWNAIKSVSTRRPSVQCRDL